MNKRGLSRFRQRYAITITLLLSLYCSKAQVSLEDEIISRANQFSKYLMNSEYDSLLQIYSSDAKIFPANMEILEGEAIRQYWIPADGSDNKVIYHKLTPQEIKLEGNIVYDWGYYEGISSSNNNESRWKGKYVVLWKKEDGQWKMYVDIWNRVAN